LKKLSTIFGVLAVLLSHTMCIVVAFDYRDMLCGIAHSCYSAPAWMAFLEAIPYTIGIAICIALAVVFRKKAKSLL